MANASTYQKLESLSAIIFWGAVWGIIAATLAHLTELIGNTYTELVVYLVALPCLAIAYRQTGLKMSPFYIALVAAAIRCIHLPFMGDKDAILQSAMWIMIEGLITAIFVTVAQLKPLPKDDTFTLKPLWTSVTLTISVMMTIAA